MQRPTTNASRSISRPLHRKRRSKNSLLKSAAILCFAIPGSGLSLAGGNSSDAAPSSSEAPKEVQLLPSKAEYTSKHGNLSATGNRILQKQPKGQWQFENIATAFFMTIKEISHATIDKGEVIPANYLFVNPFSKKKSMALAFDWSKDLVKETKYPPIEEQKLKAGMQDKLSYQLQLRLDVMSHGDNYPPTDYVIVDKKRIKTYHLEFKGEEVIDTPAGKINTVHFLQTRPGGDRFTSIWLAKDWNHLLIKLEQTEADKDTYTLLFKEGSLAGKKISGGQ